MNTVASFFFVFSEIVKDLYSLLITLLILAIVAEIKSKKGG